MAAGDAIIGALRVVLGADTAEFETGMKSARSGLAGFAKQASSIAAGIGLERVFEEFVASTVNAVKHSIQFGEELNKMSQKTGISVEELSKLKYAADLSDVSFEALGKSVGKFSKTLVEASTDSTSKAARTFAAMGITIKDVGTGAIRPTSDIIGDTAEKFKGYKEGAEKVALAIGLFGKAGANLIPFLNQGRQGLKAASDEAERFGLVIDSTSALASETFLDTLKKINASSQGFYITIARDLLPSLQLLADAWLSNKENSESLREGMSGVILTAIRVLSSEFSILIEKFRGAGREIRAFFDFIRVTDQARSIDEVRQAWNRWNLVIEDNEERLSTLKQTLATLSQNLDPESFASRFTIMTAAIQRAVDTTKRLQEEAKKTTPPGIPDAAQQNAFDNFISSQRKSLAVHQAEFEASNRDAGAKEYLKVVTQGLAIAKEKNITLSQQERLELSQTASAAALLALQMGNLAIIGQTNPFATTIIAIDATKLKMQELGQEHKDYAALSQQVAQLTTKLWMDSATSLGQSFESIGSSLSSLNSDWARAAKVGQALGAAIAFVNAYIAASEALASATFPANIAIAAGVLAKGLAMVAAIKGAVVPGHAKGGLFKVPGGAGGGDRVPFTAMLEPGELVEINSNRSDGYKSGSGARGGNGTRTVYISAGLRQIAEALIPELNAAMRDGHELKLASI